MAIRYTIICPHCKGIVESGKNRQRQYGSPIRTCPRCGRTYLDDNFAEAGLLSEKEVKERAFSWFSIIVVLMGGFFLFFGIKELTVSLIALGIILVALGLFSIISNLKYEPSEDEKFQNELRESKQRLSNPQYVIALYELGYSIPSEMFNKAKEILNYKTKSEIYRETMQSDDYDETRYLCKSFKFLSDAGEGKCMMCFQISALKKHRIKNDIGTRDISICDKCIARFDKHNNLE